MIHDITEDSQASSKAPPGYIKVRALAPGFYGKGKHGARIREGEVFYIKEGETGCWFEPVDPKIKLPRTKRQEKRALRLADMRAGRAMKDPASFIQALGEIARQQAKQDELPAGKVYTPPAEARAPKVVDTTKQQAKV